MTKGRGRWSTQGDTRVTVIQDDEPILLIQHNERSEGSSLPVSLGKAYAIPKSPSVGIRIEIARKLKRKATFPHKVSYSVPEARTILIHHEFDTIYTLTTTLDSDLPLGARVSVGTIQNCERRWLVADG
jgi:hypothetical protein